jgi:hypothetical protein
MSALRLSIIPGTPLAIITFCYVYAPLTLSHVHEFAKREYFWREFWECVERTLKGSVEALVT